MFTVLVTLATTTGTGCPSCPKAPPSACHTLCQCAFPGHCGHAGCSCKVVGGVRKPPVDRWVPFEGNPAYEVYGHEVDGVFRYTQLRPRNTRPAPRTGATFIVCRFCGQTQFLVHEHQQCHRCGMSLPWPATGSTSSPCAGGRCGR